MLRVNLGCRVQIALSNFPGWSEKGVLGDRGLSQNGVLGDRGLIFIMLSSLSRQLDVLGWSAVALIGDEGLKVQIMFASTQLAFLKLISNGLLLVLAGSCNTQ